MIDKKQFIVGLSPYIVDETWKTIEIKNGYVISFQESLHIHINEDKSFIIIGDAWQVDENLSSPQELIKSWNDKTSLEDVYEASNTWCGRYIIITCTHVILDAVGSLGLFYGKNYFSSSLKLLYCAEECKPNEMNGLAEFIHIYKRQKDNMLNIPLAARYLPGFRTIIPSLQRLLPSQRYNYIEHKTEPQLLLPSYNVLPTPEAIYSEFEKYFFASLKAMFKYYQDYGIWMAISGGRDSRVCLAALQALQLPYNLFTIYNPDAQYAGRYQDKKVGELLAKKISKKLTILNNNIKNFNQERWKEFEYHTLGLLIQDEVGLEYANQTFSPIESDADRVMYIKNQIWELVLDDYNTANILNTPEKIISEFSLGGSLFEKSIKEWIEYIREDSVNNNLSLPDRVYWDLRCGCWLADRQQAHDLKEIEVVQALNCRRFISVLMALPVELRCSRLFEEELTSRLFPPLRSVPYEEQYNDMHLIYAKYKAKIIRKLKKYLKYDIKRESNTETL